MEVVKFTGERVGFDREIFKSSILKSGATVGQVEVVLKNIENKLYDGMSTAELYVLAFNELISIKNSFAARYSLKKALRDLGPEGYYFEDWVGKLFNKLGYNTLTSVTLQGNAVTHEIDVVAIKNNELNLCECKFRNDADAKISVTTPMYFLSRFNDLRLNTFSLFDIMVKPSKGWLITNAYFTLDSIAFGEYYDINLLSWDYPINNSIKNIVDKTHFYPITCLTTLTDYEKKYLLSNNVIVVSDICLNPNCLSSFNFNPEKMELIISEATELVNFKI
jgi:hypothetical protein